MDMSFANQAFSIAYLWQHGATLENKVHPVPSDIDEQVSEMKLSAMGINIDKLTPEQVT